MVMVVVCVCVCVCARMRVVAVGESAVCPRFALSFDVVGAPPAHHHRRTSLALGAGLGVSVLYRVTQ